MQGVDVEKEVKKAKEKKAFTFQSPDEYEKMPMEERKKLTEKMMGKHKVQLDKD